MKSLLLKYKYQILIVFIGLAWVMLFNLLIQMNTQGIIYPDSYSYQNSAKDLYFFYRGHNTRPILMAFITGLPYLFGATDNSIYSFSFYLNLSSWLAFLIVLFEIIKEFLSDKLAFISTIFSVFFVANTAHIFHLQTECIYMLFIVLGFYYLLRYLKNKTFWCLSISLSLFILSMLIKPGSKFLAILFTLYFSKELIKNYKSKITFLVYGSVFAVFVQCAGMKYQFENFTISYIDVITYYGYLGAKSKALLIKEDFKDIKEKRGEYIYSQEPDKMKKIAINDLKDQMQYNRYNLIKAYLLNIVENASTGNVCIDDCRNISKSIYFNFSKNIISIIGVWQNRFFSVLGFFLGLWYLFKSIKKEIQFSFISFFILYTIILSGISCGEGDRFHVVTFPFVIILLVKLISEKTEIISKN